MGLDAVTGHFHRLTTGIRQAFKPRSAEITEQEVFFSRRAKRQRKLRFELQLRQTADFYYLIDVVGTCNLRCPSCPVGNYETQPPAGLMSLDTYRKILDKIKREHPGEQVFIDLYNWGEPGLHKQLGDIIKATKLAGFGVGISSNLNVFPDMRNVVQAGPSYIRVSLSGYFNTNYQKTHRKGDINLVKANMHLLRYWLDKTGSDTIVQVGFHVYRSNFPDDFSRMKALCEELDFIFAPTLAALMPVEKAVAAVDGKDLSADAEILENLVVSTSERVKLLEGARPQYPDCQYRQKRTTINFDGTVPLCCATFEREQIIANSFLDVDRQSLQAKKYQHSFCKTCQERSLDMIYTGVEPHRVDEKAANVLGPEFKQFVDEWNVLLEPVVEYDDQDYSVQAAFDLAMQKSTRGQTDDSIRILSSLLKVAPRHGEAGFQLGQIYLARGNWAEALRYFELAYRIWPEHQPYAQAFNKIKGEMQID